jgi:hypothetical protein
VVIDTDRLAQLPGRSACVLAVGIAWHSPAQAEARAARVSVRACGCFNIAIPKTTDVCLPVCPVCRGARVTACLPAYVPACCRRPALLSCVKSLSELGTLLVKTAFNNYNLLKSNKAIQLSPVASVARRPSLIRRKISVRVRFPVYDMTG